MAPEFRFEITMSSVYNCKLVILMFYILLVRCVSKPAPFDIFSNQRELLNANRNNNNNNHHQRQMSQKIGIFRDSSVNSNYKKNQALVEGAVAHGYQQHHYYGQQYPYNGNQLLEGFQFVTNNHDGIGASSPAPKYMLELYNKFETDRYSHPMANIVRCFVNINEGKLYLC